jgi:hypothetical protein
MNFIAWIRKSFEVRKKASARKLTVFIAFCLLNSGFIVHLITQQPIQIEFIYFYAIIVLIGLGYITAQNLVEMVKGRFGSTNFIDYEQDIYASRNRVDNPDQPQ